MKILREEENNEGIMYVLGIWESSKEAKIPEGEWAETMVKDLKNMMRGIKMVSAEPVDEDGDGEISEEEKEEASCCC